MSDHSDFKSKDIELLQSALSLILKNSAGSPLPNRLDSHLRRYSPAERKTIVEAAKGGKNVEQLKTAYGVSRDTVKKWLRRELGASVTSVVPWIFKNVAQGKEQLDHQSQDVHKGYHKNWQAVLDLWRSRPGLGPAQIRNQLYRKGIKISVATVRKILEENGYTPPKMALKEVEINRYEAVRPLELVHMDFKHFYINKQKVYLLLMQDDFSRFLMGYKMTNGENMQVVIELFEECINRYGKMQSVMTDAGSAFYSWNGINRFQKLLSEEYGVDQIKATTPRSNGKIENVNKQIEKEVLDVKLYASLEEANEAIRQWVRFYNFERTHMGLPTGMVPADRFLYGWNEQHILSLPETKRTAEQNPLETILRIALEQMKHAA